MADYYTQASFVIPCSKEQAVIALEAINQVSGELGEIAAECLSKEEENDFSVTEKLIRFFYFNHPDYDKNIQEIQGDALSWIFSAQLCPDESGVWVQSDESINTEQAAIFTQGILSVFDLDHMVEIQAAHTCNRPRLDGFGGHAFVVTKDSMEAFSTDEFVMAHTSAHMNGDKFYVCKISETCGQNHFSTKFLISIAGDDDPEEITRMVCSEWRGEGEPIFFTDGFRFGDVVAHAVILDEVTAFEFSILKNHMIVKSW
jgi:hypothetical protein